MCSARYSPRCSLRHTELIHTQLLTRLATIVVQAQTLDNHYLDALKSHVSQTESTFREVNPTKDQEIFIDHNISQFTAPNDWSFEPCATHYDTVGPSRVH